MLLHRAFSSQGVYFEVSDNATELFLPHGAVDPVFNLRAFILHPKCRFFDR